MATAELSARANHDHGDAPGSPHDPVCGMTVDPASAQYRAQYVGHDYLFCSAKCREQFIGDPKQYVAAPQRRSSGHRPRPPFELRHNEQHPAKPLLRLRLQRSCRADCRGHSGSRTWHSLKSDDRQRCDGDEFRPRYHQCPPPAHNPAVRGKMQLRRQVCARATARYLIAVIQANVGPRTSEGLEHLKASIRWRSAGTTSPCSIRMTSPGTSCATGARTADPPRSTLTCGGRSLCSALRLGP